jgi:hypothetical protein
MPLALKGRSWYFYPITTFSGDFVCMHAYRATREAWLGQLLLPLVFFALLTFTAVNASGLNPWLGGLGLTILALIAAFDYLLPMLRNWLRTDERAIQGSFDGRNFHLYWTEVLAAWIFRRGRRRFLCIGTRQRTLIVPLRFLDHQAVWECVRQSVPPSALTQGAIQSLPEYHKWQSVRSALGDGAARTIPDHWLIQVTGWAGMTFFLLGFLEALQSGAIAAAGLQAALAVISLVMLLNWGITEINEQGVQRFTLFGSWRITWAEVRRIEIDPLNAVLVLVGDDCQMVISGPGMWTGAHKKDGLAVLLAQAERHKVPLRRTSWALTRRSRKTSVRR